MRTPYNWLKKYVDTALSPQEIAVVLTMAGHALDKPVYEEAGDQVMDFEDRGNRSDTMGMVGIARDLAALTNSEYKYPELAPLPKPSSNFKPKISVHSENVKRWRALVYKNIKVSESSKEIKDALSAYGIESVNNVVDLTNYVMVEIGMPMHAFDLDKIDEVNLRMAKKGEKLITFEGTELEFDENDLLAADSRKPLTLTTAVGGKESGITDKTVNLLIEAGLYDQPTARKSAIRNNVRNESSNRLGKYLHAEYCEIACQRFVYLAKKYLGAEPEPESFDFYPNPAKDLHVELTADRLRLIGGEGVDINFAKEALLRLGFEIPSHSTHKLTALVPYFRTDVSMEDDLIEEVLRVKGYQNINSELPPRPSPTMIRLPELELENEIKDVSVKLGFIETVGQQMEDAVFIKSLGLANENGGLEAPWPGPGHLVLLENSWNKELNSMRPTLYGSLSSYLNNYLKHGAGEVLLFETGKVFAENAEKKGLEKYEETRKAGFIVNSGFFELKAVLEILLEELGFSDVKVVPESLNLFKANLSAKIEVSGKTAGVCGTVKSKNLQNPDISYSYAELSIPALLACPRKSLENNRYKVVTKVDNLVSEDFTLTLSAVTEMGGVLEKLRQNLGEGLKIKLVGVYSDDNLREKGQKNVTFNVKYSKDREKSVKEVFSSISQ